MRKRSEQQSAKGGQTSWGRRKIELTIDVTRSVRLRGPQHIAATVHLPDIKKLHTPPIVIFAAPGGGYNRNYFDLQIPGHENYSQAEYHTALGFVFVAYDPIGVGSSSSPDPPSITFEVLAKANQVAISKVTRLLESGKLDPNFPGLGRFRRIGLGQAMGGCITILMQAMHTTFDAIAVLGFSAVHTVVPQPTLEGQRASELAFSSYSRDTDLESIKRPFDHHGIQDFIYPFYWEDVPRDIVDADTRGGRPIRVRSPPWGSGTIPTCGVMMMVRGAVAKEAAAIRVPVLVAGGARDVLPAPLQEPAAYAQSTDVSLFIVDRMAHAHNFASTRHKLWQRISAWMEMVAKSPE